MSRVTRNLLSHLGFSSSVHGHVEPYGRRKRAAHLPVSNAEQPITRKQVDRRAKENGFVRVNAVLRGERIISSGLVYTEAE